MWPNPLTVPRKLPSVYIIINLLIETSPKSALLHEIQEAQSNKAYETGWEMRDIKRTASNSYC